MKRLIAIYLLVLISCSQHLIRNPNTIRISGSTTMQLFVTKWANEFTKLKPTVSVKVLSEGTANGIRALISGKADICAASRPLRAEEVRLFAEKYNKIGMSTLVAKDALSVYIHPENPVQNLTLDQVRNIFNGNVRNWSDVGGFDEPIMILLRYSDSGTYLYFKEHVLKGESFTKSAIKINRTPEIIRIISENRNATGLGGLAVGKNVVHCSINDVLPTIESVKNDSYPIIRYLYLITIKKPQGIVKEFIDWILKDGQKVVEEAGYIPLW